MYSIGVAAMLLGVCIKTLRRWDANNKIRCYRTPGGHRRFPIREIRRLLCRKEGRHKKIRGCAPTLSKCAIYGRVSSHKQSKRGDLERQLDILRAHARAHKLEIYNVYKDVGSGLNTKRKGLWRLLQDAKKDKFSLVLITHKDRLTRFGYNYLTQYLSEFNVKVRYLNELDEISPESEMVEDLVAIIHSFSGKLYGLRSAKNKKNRAG